MISAWWLLAIIPASFLGGYILCGVMSIGAQVDRCSECLYKKEKSK